MRLYIWKWGTADNGNPICNWATEEHRKDIPNNSYMFWLKPEDAELFRDMDGMERNEYVSLLYEEHVR